MPREQRIQDRDRVPPREENAASVVAEGDAPLQATPPNVSANAPPDEELVGSTEPDPDEQLAALQREFSNLSDRHLRLAAEYDNYRRRSEKERSEVWSRAQADLASRLLDALDD